MLSFLSNLNLQQNMYLWLIEVKRYFYQGNRTIKLKSNKFFNVLLLFYITLQTY